MAVQRQIAPENIMLFVCEDLGQRTLNDAKDVLHDFLMRPMEADAHGDPRARMRLPLQTALLRLLPLLHITDLSLLDLG